MNVLTQVKMLYRKCIIKSLNSARVDTLTHVDVQVLRPYVKRDLVSVSKETCYSFSASTLSTASALKKNLVVEEDLVITSKQKAVNEVGAERDPATA